MELDREALTKRATEIHGVLGLRIKGISEEDLGVLALLQAVSESIGGLDKLRTGNFPEEAALIEEMAENSVPLRVAMDRFWEKK